MRIRTISLATFLMAMCVAAAAGPAQTAPPAPNPLDSISWLVGGKWVANGEKGPDGKPFHVEDVVTWGDNGHIIQFTTRFLEDGKLVPVYSGVYVWNPARQRFAFLYTDNHGSMTTGEAHVDGDTLEHEFEIVGADGASHPFHFTITRRGPDDYDWNVSRLADGKWQEMFGLKYKRSRD